jgi:hypothetical protein
MPLAGDVCQPRVVLLRPLNMGVQRGTDGAVKALRSVELAKNALRESGTREPVRTFRAAAPANQLESLPAWQ